MISDSNLGRKSFRLYLEMGFSSLFREEIPCLINLYAICLYLETDKCLSLIPIFLVALVREKDFKNQESYYFIELCFVECIKLVVLILNCVKVVVLIV